MEQRRTRAVVLLGLVSLLGAALLGVRSTQRAIAAAPRPVDATFVTSSTCASCHPQHAASFARTFHRTMTRDATRETVLAPFDGETLRYGDLEATFTTSAGRFYVEVRRGGELVERDEVVRTVGSHRYQQFLARRGDHYERLAWAFHVEEQRYFSMNEAFLTPDPTTLDEGHVSDVDAHRHVVRWDDNCIFCHNVGATPHLAEDGTFASSVAELGVACEACHGPASAHVAANRSPLRRYALHAADASLADSTIVNPARLTTDRQNDVCGHCHGQRLTDDVHRVLVEGDRFVPGEDLALHSSPLFVDTPLRGDDDAFRARFYDEGTPRLTAYEYQGLLLSRCEMEGDLSCTRCHSMHEGDPRGQLRPSVRGDTMCTDCHEELAPPAARREHTDHDDVACVDCHMPRVVFGLRDVLRSHRIDRPTREGRPDACALCHLERGMLSRSEGSSLSTLEAAFAGDPIERAVATRAIGTTTAAFDRDRRLALLATIARDDRYPAVRAIALEGLARWLPAGSAPSMSLATEARSTRVAALASLPSYEVTPTLRALAEERAARSGAIEIGE